MSQQDTRPARTNPASEAPLLGDAFGLLGAQVTVVDLSDAQLQRDQNAADHHGVTIRTVQADMRDLSGLDPATFDLVWQPYSINFVPDAHAVFRQVARVVRPGGVYHVQCANPFVCGLTGADWNGEGYVLRRPYRDGDLVAYTDEAWVYRDRVTTPERVPGPREYRHGLSTMVNGLTEQGFAIQHVSETWAIAPDPTAAPGTWHYLVAFAPPWLAF